MEILRVEHLSKIYGTGENAVKALDNVSFSVHKGDFVAITAHPARGSQHYCIYLAALTSRRQVRYMSTVRTYIRKTPSSWPYSGAGRWGLYINSTT